MKRKDPALQAHLEQLLRRDHTLYGAVLFGIDGRVIELQARAVAIANSEISWHSSTQVTGMARGAVSEALDRISGAFSKLGIPPPPVEILINLAPADLPKEGASLDLPIAIIMLQAAGLLPDLSEKQERGYILFGELGLHADLRRIPGALSMAFAAQPGQVLIVPEGNHRECALVKASADHPGCHVAAVSGLKQVIEFFAGKSDLDNALAQKIEVQPAIPQCIDFGAIRGQDRAKEGAVIAAAGGHNLLLIGPPGEGKSLLASALPGILPWLRAPEKVELTRIYSACGKLETDGMAVTRRPARSVHHTASKQSLVGGGSGTPRPGEVTLAHLGVLFLDELAEFSRSTLDALREPIEEGRVTVSRVGGSFTYPCRFTLVAAMNPCPCGYFGSDRCRCREPEIKKYQGKISGPILDRIDLQVEMSPLTNEQRFAETGVEASPRIRDQVEAARERQRLRFAGTTIPFNAAIPGGRVRDYARFSPPGFDQYKSTIESHTLTTRSTDRLAKVARTVADLNASDEIMPDHVQAAAGFVVGGVLREAL